MLSLLVILAGGAPIPRPPASDDSAALVAHVRDVEFKYIMDWRHEWEMWQVDLAFTRQHLRGKAARVPIPSGVMLDSDGATLYRRPGGTCDVMQVIRFDIDQHEWMAHAVRDSTRPALGLCPNWVSPADTEPADESLSIDGPLTPEYRDTVRSRRRPLIALLDGAAHALPGDPWLAGQRVRMHVDQDELAQAMAATRECRAAAWWCGVLRGYVYASEHETVKAGAAFDTAIARMPSDTACAWGNVAPLLVYSAQIAYEKMSCAQQATINARIWWLADPLYLVPGNERKVEHYARHVLAALHEANDVDEREDVRRGYAGPAQEQMIIRYGWPTTYDWIPRQQCTPQLPTPPGGRAIYAPPLCSYVAPPGWSRFDTRSTYLGILGGPHPPRPEYWGPEYHTIPSWSAIIDPMSATASAWELGPQRVDTLLWDSSWWAPEFYQRYEGPLVDLSTQIAFVRRQATAAIVAAPEWQGDVNHLRPPVHAIVGVITAGAPQDIPRSVGVKMNGDEPRAVFTPIASRPLLLSVEMVPENDSGPAGRTRFGVTPPQPLNALAHGTIAISDIMLVRAGPGQPGPATIQDVLPRMYGSTTLHDPSRLAVFWEVYGQDDHDTVDVAFRIVRRRAADLLAKAGSVIGLGSATRDSVVVGWREPRYGDPKPTTEGNVPVRSRSLVVDVGALPAGDYSMDVRVTRKGVTSPSPRRDFTIVR